MTGCLSTSVIDPGLVGEERDQEKVDDTVKQPGAWPAAARSGEPYPVHPVNCILLCCH